MPVGLPAVATAAVPAAANMCGNDDVATATSASAAVQTPPLPTSILACCPGAHAKEPQSTQAGAPTGTNMDCHDERQ